MENLKSRIEKALDQVRPYLEKDGGDVRLHNITADFCVELELLGACESCSMSAMTLRAGIEEAIKKIAPEITSVKAINTQPA